MRIFELHFNPDPKEDLIFDSFCYEPGNIYEKRLGSLFTVGELKNALPQNVRFLDNLANFLKKQYYSSSTRFSPESALKEGLKKTNEFLERIVKSGDVSWLGNLNSAIFNLVFCRNKWWEINFTKTGDIKILLLRNGEIIDISKNLEFQDIEPYPLKIFGNIVSGKLIEGDIILAVTKDIFSVFADSPLRFSGRAKKGKSPGRFPSIFEQIAGLSPFDGNEGKKIKEILKTKDKELLKASGTCLLCFLSKEAWAEDKKPRIFTFQREMEKFSVLQVFDPVIGAFKNVKSKLLKTLAKMKEAPKKLFKLKKRKTEPKARKPKIKISLRRGRIEIPDNLKKNLISVLLLIFFLFAGFLIFKREEQSKLKEYKFVLEAVNQDILQADSFLILENKEKAFPILKEAWQKLLPLTEKKSAIQKEAVSLKGTLEEKLERTSSLEKIANPELIFEFDEKEFIPQKISCLDGNLYLFSSFSSGVYKLTENGEKSLLSADLKFNEAAPEGDSLLFFNKPNLILALDNGLFREQFSLLLPYPDFDPKDFGAYQQSIYFLDRKNSEIIKYPAPISTGKNNPQLWLKRDTKKATDPKSVAVNGSIWILSADNTIFRYFGGDFQNSLTLDFFPFVKDLLRITSQSELLYLLEPVHKRLIVLDKNGKVQKQFQSEKFDNLKDFAVSENGRTIWLLNGVKVYRIEF